MLLDVTQVVGAQTQPRTATATSRSTTSTGGASALMLTRINAGGQIVNQIIVEIVEG